MRILKFRAWDNHNHKMIYIGIDLKSFIGWEIMQYTGLIDKNGKEIYEGDIIGLYTHNTTYDKEYFCRQSIREVKIEEHKHYIGYNFGKSNRFEVIGNIWENPELLKTLQSHKRNLTI